MGRESDDQGTENQRGRQYIRMDGLSPSVEFWYRGEVRRAQCRRRGTPAIQELHTRVHHNEKSEVGEERYQAQRDRDQAHVRREPRYLEQTNQGVANFLVEEPVVVETARVEIVCREVLKHLLDGTGFIHGKNPHEIHIVHTVGEAQQRSGG